MTENKLIIGTAPDSWGVWFADDPKQTPWERFLDEVAESGYKWIELGPYGYLPNDPVRLAEELKQRDLKVCAGTVFTAFHRGLDQWETAWEPARKVAELTAAMGGEHIVVIPEPWRDHKTGEPKEDPDLSEEQWNLLTGQTDELGRRILEEYGLHVQFHSHADTHVGYQPEIERFLEGTNPEYVNLCLDTGHVAYYGGDCVELITKYPERIGYVHIKQMDPAILAQVAAENLSFGEAVKRGVCVSPPAGVPDPADVVAELAALDRDLFCIVEQDLYPCPPDVPLPIAQRTFRYYADQGLRVRE